ncbi:hypothetical protein ACC735_39935, partial [Rhizobium ruizarguesonis]
LHDMAIRVLPYNTPDTALQARGLWSGATLARLYMDLHIPDHIERLLYLDADVLAVSPVDRSKGFALKISREEFVDR